MDSKKKLGIENLKIVMLFLIVFSNTIGKMWEDKKFNYLELMLFVPLFQDIGKFIKSLIPSGQEALDLDDEERIELIQFFVLKFSLENKECEIMIEKIVGFILQLTVMIITIRSIFVKDKKEKLEDTQSLIVDITSYQNYQEQALAAG